MIKNLSLNKISAKIAIFPILKFEQGYPLVPLYYGHFYGLFPKKNNFFSLTGYVQAKKAFFSRSKKSKKLKK